MIDELVAVLLLLLLVAVIQQIYGICNICAGCYLFYCNNKQWKHMMTAWPCCQFDCKYSSFHTAYSTQLIPVLVRRCDRISVSDISMNYQGINEEILFITQTELLCHCGSVSSPSKNTIRSCSVLFPSCFQVVPPLQRLSSTGLYSCRRKSSVRRS